MRFAIAFKFRAPLTAKRYVEGLNKKVQSLKVGADAIQIDKAFSAQYGYDVRRINYKEMAILYSIGRKCSDYSAHHTSKHGDLLINTLYNYKTVIPL